MDKKHYTVKEVADMTGLSRQAIYNKMTSQFKKDFTSLTTVNNRQTLVISVEGVDNLTSGLDKVDSQVDNPVDMIQLLQETMKRLEKDIDYYKQELEKKDNVIQRQSDQISELIERNREQNILMKNNQQLLLEDGQSFWKKLFKKRSNSDETD